MLHEGYCVIPDNKLGNQLIGQAKLVSAKPAPGGTVTIKIPRKVGMGHGDLVSAWTLAVHALAYKNAEAKQIVYEYGSPEWQAEFDRRVRVAQDKQQAE